MNDVDLENAAWADSYLAGSVTYNRHPMVGYRFRKTSVSLLRFFQVPDAE